MFGPVTVRPKLHVPPAADADTLSGGTGDDMLRGDADRNRPHGGGNDRVERAGGI